MLPDYFLTIIQVVFSADLHLFPGFLFEGKSSMAIETTRDT
jgi:hypothetical protein